MKKFDICMKYADKWQEDGKWFVTNEFVCSTFAGRCFEGETIEEAIQNLVNYFDKETQYNISTIVKDNLHRVGWFKDVDNIDEKFFVMS